MERRTATTVANLQKGDKFYKAADKGKTVLTIVEGETYQTMNRNNSFFCKRDGDRFPQPINPNTSVVFLRHSNDQ